jgi:hypothetical protein
MGSNYSSGLKCDLGAHSVETLSWRKSGNILIYYTEIKK